MQRFCPTLQRLGRLTAIALFLTFLGPAVASAETKLHYAPNHNFALDGAFSPASAGFNLADVSGLHEIKRLKPSELALVWVGRCGGVDKDFLRIVRPYARRRDLFGFFLMDDPDPRLFAEIRNPSHACASGNLRAEADWIHDNIPGAKTIIVLMNMATTVQPSFINTYEPANSHVDLFGLAAYPCRSSLPRCDYGIIDRYVAAAVDAGISRDRIVPIYQTFGGGDWKTETGGHYVCQPYNRLPTSCPAGASLFQLPKWTWPIVGACKKATSHWRQRPAFRPCLRATTEATASSKALNR
ncbi:hypothetical protein [Rhodopila sp.]|uniref:hypothetical protein n=1 Tax=Rhodopila sp. TaxID=2480087 RepID=UPI003D1182FB